MTLARGSQCPGRLAYDGWRFQVTSFVCAVFYLQLRFDSVGIYRLFLYRRVRERLYYKIRNILSQVKGLYMYGNTV